MSARRFSSARWSSSVESCRFSSLRVRSSTSERSLCTRRALSMASAARSASSWANSWSRWECSGLPRRHRPRVPITSPRTHSGQISVAVMPSSADRPARRHRQHAGHPVDLFAAEHDALCMVHRDRPGLDRVDLRRRRARRSTRPPRASRGRDGPRRRPRSAHRRARRRRMTAVSPRKLEISWTTPFRTPGTSSMAAARRVRELGERTRLVRCPAVEGCRGRRGRGSACSARQVIVTAPARPRGCSPPSPPRSGSRRRGAGAPGRARARRGEYSGSAPPASIASAASSSPGHVAGSLARRRFRDG